MVKDLRKFLMRGNIVDLAVAVVIGAAFGALVTALVNDMLTPIVAALIGKPDFSDLTFTINGSVFRYGEFLNALIAFLSIATAVFFFVVQPMNRLQDRARRRREPEAQTKPDDVMLLEEIRDLLKAGPADRP